MSITDTTRLTRPLPALLCLLLIAGPALAREPAGKIIFSAGTVAIEATDQTTRSATKGMAVFAGETLVANDGIIQVEFADGGFFSVQPQSRLKIEDYRFNGTEDGSESAIFKLLKGGLRAISGAIGHRHPKRYQLHTVVATIGIRGTAYSALLCQQDCLNADGSLFADGLHATTTQDTIYIENKGGILDVPVGRAAFVRDHLSPPAHSVFSPSFAALKPPGPAATASDSPTATQSKPVDTNTGSEPQEIINIGAPQEASAHLVEKQLFAKRWDQSSVLVPGRKLTTANTGPLYRQEPIAPMTSPRGPIASATPTRGPARLSGVAANDSTRIIDASVTPSLGKPGRLPETFDALTPMIDKSTSPSTKLGTSAAKQLSN